MKLGIDYLGAGGNRRYRNRICKFHPKGSAAGFLCRASGWRNGIRAARQLAKTGRCPVMRIHGLWLDNHNFERKHIRVAVRQAKKVAKLAKRFPQIKFYFSPWLEHREQSLFDKCAAKCKAVLPCSVDIVSSGPRRDGYIHEVHHSGPSQSPYFYSYDGADMRRENVRGDKILHRDARLFFGWIPQCNGRAHLNDTTPRRKRTHYLKQSDFVEIKRLLRS